MSTVPNPRPVLWWSAVVLATVLVAAGLLGVWSAGHGLRSEFVTVAGVPVEIVRPAGAGDGTDRPVVVVAHGYAGSGRLMRPFADTFARRGYLVALPDLAGHAANTRPLTTDSEIDSELAAVVHYVRGLPGVDPAKVVLLGHSMGAAAVVRVAAADPLIAATVAISTGDSAGAALRPGPRRLLLLVGAWEPAGVRAVAQAAAAADPGERRMVQVPFVEHIGVLYADRTHREAAHWFDDALQHHPDQPVIAAKARVAAGGLGLAGMLLLVFAAAIRLMGRWVTPVTWPVLPDPGRLAGAVLTAPVAGLVGGWVAARILPSAVSGYLVGYFACTGLVLGPAAMRLRVRPPATGGERHRLGWTALTVVATAAVVVPIHLGLTSVLPQGGQLVMIVLLTLATGALLGGAHAAVGLPYSVAILVLVCLPLPVAALIGLAPGFLALVSPLIAALLGAHLLLAGLAWRTGTPWWRIVPAGALMLAWPVAAALPLT